MADPIDDEDDVNDVESSGNNEKEDRNEAAQANEDDETAEFKNLELTGFKCFGFKQSDDEDTEEDDSRMSWVELAQKSNDIGWSGIDAEMLGDSLDQHVNEFYMNAAVVMFEDIDTAFKWELKYVNDKSLWQLQIKDSPEAEIDIEQKKSFMQADVVKKALRDIGDVLANAKKTFDNIVKTHLENGEMLQVDEVKLAAILFWLDDRYFIDNLRQGKFIY